MDGGLWAIVRGVMGSLCPRNPVTAALPLLSGERATRTCLLSVLPSRPPSDGA